MAENRKQEEAIELAKQELARTTERHQNLVHEAESSDSGVSSLTSESFNGELYRTSSSGARGSAPPAAVTGKLGLAVVLVECVLLGS